jgi:hypothetical protein
VPLYFLCTANLRQRFLSTELLPDYFVSTFYRQFFMHPDKLSVSFCQVGRQTAKNTFVTLKALLPLGLCSKREENVAKCRK